MIIKPLQLGEKALNREEMLQDRKECRKFGPCGVGEKALYLNSFYVERRYYVPFSSVTRVFKRIAMSKGGFTGRGVFASIPYLVVEFDGGKQKQCNFKHEEQVDRLLDYLRTTHPHIRLHSEAGEHQLEQKQRRLEERKQRIASAKARKEIESLERAAAYLEEKPELYRQLSAASKKKRIYDRTNPTYKWVALFITLLGFASAAYGIYALSTKAGFAMYFLLFGLAAIFLFSSANVLPTAKNNRRAIEKSLKEAQEQMEQYLTGYEDFPLPARYAHPGVLSRMIEALAMEQAAAVPESLEVVKRELKALNSSVTVEQEAFDEIMAIKPMFLVNDYQ